MNMRVGIKRSTSSSSTAEEEEGAPSPVLPPLPEPKFNGHIVKVSSTRTPPSNDLEEQTNFFTTSWGSPYQTSNPIPLEFNNQSQSNSSEEDSSESPIHNLNLHTSFLRPAPLIARANTELESGFQERLISAAVLANRARRRKQGLTEDWIRKHTCGKSAESSHWLSDGEQSDISSLTESGLSSEINPSFEEQDPQTPTLKTYLESIGLENPRKNKKRKLSVSTLRQEDFSYGPESPRIASNSSIMQEKPMDNFPQRPRSSSSSIWRSAALSSLVGSPPSNPMLVAAPRVKKKIPWNTKHIVIFLPIDDNRGEDGNAPFPMTEDETQKRIKNWQDMHYDTRGFNLAPVFAVDQESDPTQSRPCWPLPRDIEDERQQKSYNVSVPDRREWDIYVQELQEAKLRSLGVSLGDEDSNPSPFTIPAVPSMGRRASIQYPPLPYSPPIPPSSATSSNVNLNPFSPVIIPGASMSTYHDSHPASMASPLTINGSSHVKYNPRHSISFSTNDHPFGMPFHFNHQPSQTSWSPGNLLQKQGMVARGRSPSMQNLGTVISPMQSFSTDGYFPQNSDKLSNLQRQGIMQTHISQSPSQIGMSQASPRLHELEEQDEENQDNTRNSSKTPDKWQPENNFSKTTSKEEIDTAEYHLEGQIQRELEHDDYSPHSEKSIGISKNQIQNHTRDFSVISQGVTSTRPTSNHREDSFLHHPQPHSRSHSLFQENKQSFIDQNNVHSIANEKQDASTANFETFTPKNSVEKTYNQDIFGNFNPWHEKKYNHYQHTSNLNSSTLNHRHKASISKLNVAAKEFTLNNPINSVATATIAPPGAPIQHTTFPPQNFPSHLNGMARPHASTIEPRLTNMAENSHVLFNFSSPMFIPAFNQSSISTIEPPLKENISSHNRQTQPDSSSRNAGSSNYQSSVPTDVDPSRILAVKPSKNSKAIPIVRPDNPKPLIQKSVVPETDDKNQVLVEGPCSKSHDIEQSIDPPVGELNEPPDEKPEISVIENVGLSSQIVVNDEYSPESTVEDLQNASEVEKKHEIALRIFQNQENAENYDGSRLQSPHKEANLSIKGMNIVYETKDPNVLMENKEDASPQDLIAKSSEFKLPHENYEQELRSPKLKSPVSYSSSKSTPILSHKSLQSSNQLNFSDFIDHSGSKYARKSMSPESKKTPKSTEPSRLHEWSRSNQMPLNHFDSPKVQNSPGHKFSSKNQVIETASATKEAVSHLPDYSKTDVLPQRKKSREISLSRKFSSARCIKVPDLDSSSPIRFLPDQANRSDTPGPSSEQLRAKTGEMKISIQGREDLSPLGSPYKPNYVPKYDPASEFDDVYEAEGSKIWPRSQVFDSHVQIIICGILEKKLSPFEKTLRAIRESIASLATQRSLLPQDRQKQQSQADVTTTNLPAIINEAVERKFSSKNFLADLTNNPRITDLESKLGLAEARTDEEVQIRRAAEDRLSEIQRQLRISSEEEHRLRAELEQREVRIREILDESDAKVRSVEADHTKSLVRISVLEAADQNEKKIETDLRENIKKLESDLRATQLESQRWQVEAERLQESALRNSQLLEQANETIKDLRHTIGSLKIQSEESIRVREVMRGKLIGLQEDMANAAREVTNENARRAKKEQELIARQEMLDARLQAEGRTRERLEREIDRLEKGERDGLRAVSECKKLEVLVDELKEESNLAKKDALQYQRELEVAKEAGMSQVQRNRQVMDAELDAANERMNIMRENFERQIFNLRADIHQARLESDNARARNELLIEEAEASKNALRSDFDAKLADTVEDLKTQHYRRLQVTTEESQRHEEHLLERLSLSSAKTEHLQDRIAHLEEKLEIANAGAPSLAFKATGVALGPSPPEKISPQALRESILSLQEQLQERESTIESLRSTISSLDPEAKTKISKRDDEIMWLRELLAVRKSDLTDLVQSLEMDQLDVARVKDAAIRLRTSLQMQEQELERAINGGSALPNLAASLREKTTPRVAQAVGPLVAVWDSWRKGKADEISVYEGGILSNTSTRDYHHLLDELLPSSTPKTRRQSKPISKFNLFGSGGQRFSSEQLANRPRLPIKSIASQRANNIDTGAKELDEVRNSEETDDEIKRKTNFPSIPDQLSILADSSYDQDASEARFKEMSFYNGESSVDSVEN
ncbi:myosin class II heavy chain [Golovinomyces cichoracearum]|uniref:Myosin class II heavy chain n=1 Tax=Golovinomyces cichoracearum TaxID=62708 RepID=A0A420IFS8_9PEZI|nr:myosin class II heavy chain [Golovinomyces cichoracearum]